MLEVQWFACYWKSRPYLSVWSLPSMVPSSWNSKGNSHANLCFTRFPCGSQLYLSLSNACQEQNFHLNLEANELWVITHCSLFICWYTFIEGFILRNSHNCGESISSISVGLTAGCSELRRLAVQVQRWHQLQQRPYSLSLYHLADWQSVWKMHLKALFLHDIIFSWKLVVPV